MSDKEKGIKLQAFVRERFEAEFPEFLEKIWEYVPTGKNEVTDALVRPLVTQLKPLFFTMYSMGVACGYDSIRKAHQESVEKDKPEED